MMYEDRNKMGLKNLSVIFAPSCFAATEGLADMQNAFTKNTKILENLIRNVDNLVPKLENDVPNLGTSGHVLRSSVMTDANDGYVIYRASHIRIYFPFI